MSLGRLGSVVGRINRKRMNNWGGFVDSVGRLAGGGFGGFSLGWVGRHSCSSAVGELCSSDDNEETMKRNLRTPLRTLPLRISKNVSIESIKLKINNKTKAPRHIYGEIKVCSPLTYIFRRHRKEAQLVPYDDDGFPLILCGPNHMIWSDDLISVELYESRSRPFITAKYFPKDHCDYGKFQIPLQEHVDTPDRSARLTLTYTRIAPSCPAIFQFRLIQAQALVFVSGTIRGIQLLPEGTTTSWITIFDSRGEAVAVPKGEPIPLDRFYFIVPVQTGKQGEEGFKGGSFNIHVDLQLHTNSFKLFSIKGQANVVFTRHDKMGQPKFFTVGRSSDGPVIQISVTNFNEYLPKGDIEQSLEH